MALKGNLRDFSFTQLLNLINLAKKSGTLVLESPNGSAWVAFREGKLAYAQIGQEDNSLVGILFKAKKINPNQQRAIQARAVNMNDKELGLLLINANYLSQQDILNSLQTYLVDVVGRLYTWIDGNFRFDGERLPPTDRITLRLSLENLIVEGVRQMREQEQLKDEIPSLDMALKFTERPGTNIRNLSLNAREWKVVSFISPKNSIRQIARAVRLNEVEIRRIIFALLQAGLVEMVRPVGAPAYARQSITPGIPQTSKEEQKSLITRLIQRIRAI
jgi:hypothetical protein